MDFVELNGMFSVPDDDETELPLSDDMQWFRKCIRRLIEGGTYLVAGQPGIGKSTIAVQVAMDIALAGLKSLFILTEQKPANLANLMRQLSSDWPESVRRDAMNLISTAEGLTHLGELPRLLANRILIEGEKFHGVKLIVIDSIQGHGLSASSTKEYKELYEFCQMCKKAKITVILISQVNKRGDFSGPKALEHCVDCPMYFERKLPLRFLFIEKNRFGIANTSGIPMEMDNRTRRMKLSPLSASESRVALTSFGSDKGLTEIQVFITLPEYNEKSKLNTHGIPKGEIQQALTHIGEILRAGGEELDYNINCRMPDGKKYRSNAGLAMYVALFATLRRKEIPEGSIFLGEVDLLKKVRGVTDLDLKDLVSGLKEGDIKLPLRVYCPMDVATGFKEHVEGLTIVGSERLEDVVFDLWPELKKVNQE